MADQGPDDWIAAPPPAHYDGPDDWVTPGAHDNGLVDRNGSGVPVPPDTAQGVHTSAVPSRSIGDVAVEAAENLLPSAANTAGSIYHAVRHPIDTAEAFANAGRGAGQELAHAMRGDAATADKTDQEKAFDSLMGYFHGRYGSTDGFKNAVATDPIGVMTDLSVLFSGGAGLAKLLPSAADKTAEIANAAAKIANPVNAIAKTTSGLSAPLGSGIADVVGGLGTHTGAEPLKLAYGAGRTGGDAAQSFLDNMRGNVPLEDVVNSARSAVSQLRMDKNAAYREGMAGVSNDKTVLDFKPIDDAISKAGQVKNFKGVNLNPETTDVRNQIRDIITDWKGLDPTEYHTPEGFDALKQRLGYVRDDLPYNTPQRLIADQAYNAVRDSITAQAPQYAKVMKDYSTAQDLIGQMDKSLSLGKKASVDTALRKLQSVMRNNVNTNYGQRGALVDKLAEAGQPNLKYELAGQSLNKLTPRGLGAAEAGAAGLAALGTGHVTALAAAPLVSPRLMGEAAYLLGNGARLGSKAAPAIDRAVQAAPLVSEVDRPAEALQPAYAKGGAVTAHRDPSQAQIEAGNYRKGHVKMLGFDISIETPKGATRRGVGADGKPWENRHPSAHYGYIKRTEGADGEHVDVYLGPARNSRRVFVANQTHPETGKFDEHKVILGAQTLKQAGRIYDEGFSDKSGPKRRQSIHEVTPEQFKAWLRDGDTSKPFEAMAHAKAA